MGRVSGRSGWTRLVEGLRRGPGCKARGGGSAGGSVKGQGDAPGVDGGDGRALARLADSERAVARLPLFEREVWWLAARDDLTIVEIADLLGIGSREVEAYLAKALVALASGLDAGGQRGQGDR